MKVDYLCKSWQFMLQQLVYLISRGYVYYYVGEIPLNKASKAKKIDEKIITKYNINLDKYQRSRKKKKKLANFYYLRWKNQFVILHTEGKIEQELEDNFLDIRKKQKERLKIKVNDNLMFNVVLQNKENKVQSATVCLDNTTYKEFRTEIDEMIKEKKIKKLEEHFKKMRGLPAWKGVIKQEYLLLEEVYKYAKKYNLNTKKRNIIKYPKQYPNLDLYPLKINTHRKIYNRDYTNDDIAEWL